MMTTKLSRTTVRNPGLPTNQKTSAILHQVDLAWLLDDSIHIPLINYRIGLDA